MQLALSIGLSVTLLGISCSRGSDSPRAQAPRQHHPFAMDRLAPSEALLVASTTDWKTIREVAADNAWVRLFGDETAWDLRTLWTAGPWGFVPEADPLGAWQQVDGSALWYITLADDRSMDSMAFVVEPQRSDADLAGLWTWVDVMVGPSQPAQEETVGEHTVRIHESHNTLVFFDANGFEGLVYSDSRERALNETRRLLERIDSSEAANITQSEAYRDFADHRSRGAIASLYWPVQSTVQRWMHEARNDDQEVLRTFGALEIPWAGADLVLGTGEYASLHVRAPIPPDSLWEALFEHAGSLPLDLIDDLPAESFTLALANADWAQAVQTLEREMEQRSQRLAGVWSYSVERFESDTGLRLQQDVLAPLRGPIAMALVPVPWRIPDLPRRVEQAMAGWLMGQSPLFVAAIRDEKTVDRTLRTMTREPEEGRPALRMAQHTAYPLAQPQDVLAPHYVIPQDREDLLGIGLQLPPLVRLLRRVDRKEDLAREELGALRNALQAHKVASFAVVLANRTWATMVVESARQITRHSRDGWDRLRWPSSISMAQRLKGYTVAALSVQNGMLHFQIETR